MGWKSTSAAVRHYSYNLEDMKRDRLDIERLHGEINPVSTYSDVAPEIWVSESRMQRRVEALYEEGLSVEEIHAVGIPLADDILSRTGIIGIIERYEARKPKKREQARVMGHRSRIPQEDGVGLSDPETRQAFAKDWLSRNFGTFQEPERPQPNPFKSLVSFARTKDDLTERRT